MLHQFVGKISPLIALIPPLLSPLPPPSVNWAVISCRGSFLMHLGIAWLHFIGVLLINVVVDSFKLLKVHCSFNTAFLSRRSTLCGCQLAVYVFTAGGKVSTDYMLNECRVVEYSGSTAAQQRISIVSISVLPPALEAKVQSHPLPAAMLTDLFCFWLLQDRLTIVALMYIQGQVLAPRIFPLKLQLIVPRSRKKLALLAVISRPQNIQILWQRTLVPIQQQTPGNSLKCLGCRCMLQLFSRHRLLVRILTTSLQHHLMLSWMHGLF